MANLPKLPTGTVTFLLTDVEGSTALWEHSPAQMRVALVRHDALIEALVVQHRGVVVRPRGEGDSRFAVFSRPDDALMAAAAIQRALHDEPWPVATPIRVHMALHTGEADVRDGDYYGSDVNRCARLRTLAHGGQTLVSRATADLVQARLPAGVGLRVLGERRLVGLRRPELVHQLLVSGLQSDFPPLGPSTNVLAELLALGSPSRRFAALAGASAVCAAACIVAVLVLDRVLVPYRDLARLDAARGELARWFWVAEMLGYSLLLVPPALYLWVRLRSQHVGVAALSTCCGLAHASMGAAMGAALAAAGPALARAYPVAPAEQRASLDVIIRVADVTSAVVWNVFVAALGGAWWLGIGLLLWRERRALGVFTATLGALALLDAAGTILHFGDAAAAGRWGYVYLTAVWAAWLGGDLLRSAVAGRLPRMRAAASAVNARPPLRYQQP